MKYCTHCGKEVMEEAVICPGCGCAIENSADVASIGQTVNEAYLNGKDKITMALICFFLGGFGVHNFMLGENKKGIFKIVMFFVFGISGILSLIDLIRILTDKYEVNYNRVF